MYGGGWTIPDSNPHWEHSHGSKVDLNPGLEPLCKHSFTLSQSPANTVDPPYFDRWGKEHLTMLIPLNATQPTTASLPYQFNLSGLSFG